MNVDSTIERKELLTAPRNRLEPLLPLRDGVSGSAEEKDSFGGSDEELNNETKLSKIYRKPSIREKHEFEALITSSDIGKKYQEDLEPDLDDELTREISNPMSSPYSRTPDLQDDFSLGKVKFQPPLDRNISTPQNGGKSGSDVKVPSIKKLPLSAVENNEQYQDMSNFCIPSQSDNFKDGRNIERSALGNITYTGPNGDVYADAEGLAQVKGAATSADSGSQYQAIPFIKSRQDGSKGIETFLPLIPGNRETKKSSLEPVLESGATVSEQYAVWDPMLLPNNSNPVSVGSQQQYASYNSKLINNTSNSKPVRNQQHDDYNVTLMQNSSNPVHSNYQSYNTADLLSNLSSEVTNQSDGNEQYAKFDVSAASNLDTFKQTSNQQYGMHSQPTSQYGAYDSLLAANASNLATSRAPLTESIYADSSLLGDISAASKIDHRTDSSNYGAFPVLNQGRSGQAFSDSVYGDCSELRNVAPQRSAPVNNGGDQYADFSGLKGSSETPVHSNQLPMSAYQDASIISNMKMPPNLKRPATDPGQYGDYSKIAKGRQDRAKSNPEDTGSLPNIHPTNANERFTNVGRPPLSSSHDNMCPYQDGAALVNSQYKMMSKHSAPPETRKPSDQYQPYDSFQSNLLGGNTTLGITQGATLGAGSQNDQYIQFSGYNWGTKGGTLATANGSLQTTFGGEQDALDSLRRIQQQGDGLVGVNKQVPMNNPVYPNYSDLYPIRKELDTNLSPRLLKGTSVGYISAGRTPGTGYQEYVNYDTVIKQPQPVIEAHGSNQYADFNSFQQGLKLIDKNYDTTLLKLTLANQEQESKGQYDKVQKLKAEIEAETPKGGMQYAGVKTTRDIIKFNESAEKNKKSDGTDDVFALPKGYNPLKSAQLELDNVQDATRAPVEYKVNELAKQRIGAQFTPNTHTYGGVAVDDSEKKADLDRIAGVSQSYKDSKNVKQVKRKLSKQQSKSDRHRRKVDVYSKSKNEWFMAHVRKHKKNEISVLYNNGDENHSKKMEEDSPHIRVVKGPKYAISPPTLEEMYRNTFARIKNNVHLEMTKSQGLFGRKKFLCFNGKDFVEWVKRETNVREDSVVQQLGTELISNELVQIRKHATKKKEDENTIINNPNSWYSLNPDKIKNLIENYKQVKSDPLKGGEEDERLHWEVGSYLEVFSISSRKWELCHVEAALDPWLMVMYGEKDKKRAKWVHRLDHQAVRSPRYFWKRGTRVHVFSRTEKLWYSGVISERKCQYPEGEPPVGESTIDTYYGPRSNQGNGYTLSKTLDVNSDHVRPRILQHDRFCLKVTVNHLSGASKIHRLRGPEKVNQNDLKMIKHVMSKYSKSDSLVYTVRNVKENENEALLIMEHELEIEEEQLQKEEQHLSEQLGKQVKLEPIHYKVYER